MAEIVKFTAEVIRLDQAPAVDSGRLGNCPRCGRPVIEGKRGYGCSGWRDGCPFVLWRQYRDQTLTEDQVRELLQRRVIGPLTIDGSIAVLVHLTDNGGVTEVPVPTGNAWKAKANQSKRRSARRPTSSAPGTKARPRKGARRHQEPAPRGPETAPAQEPPEITPRAREQAKHSASLSLGPCPLCGCDVVDQPKSYSCSGWQRGCRFTVWKTIAGKAISVRTVQSLLKGTKGPLLKGFRSKAGKPFEARLKLEGGEVRFDFD
jgi:DNA topoisomerase-3